MTLEEWWIGMWIAAIDGPRDYFFVPLRNAYQEDGLFCHGGLSVGAWGVSDKELCAWVISEEASVGVSV